MIVKFRPFVKYCVVGASGTLIDLAVLFLLVEYLAMPVLSASVIAFVSAVTNNFTWNKLWTFRNNSKNYRKLYIKFFLISLVGLSLTLLSMYLFVEIFDLWYMFAKMLTSLIVLVWNFLGNKLWTFRLREKNLVMPEDYDYKFSIIIPAYNEENRIKNTLLAVDDYLRLNALEAEIIVVSDGSSDKTGEIVRRYGERLSNLRLLEYEKNQGKGFAVKTGVEASKGEYILFTDADNSTPIEELKNLKRCLDESGADVAIGSRYLSDDSVKIRQPLYRVLLGRVGNFLIRLFLLDDIKDTQCGFKLFKHRVAREIFYFQKVRRFGFDMEALVVANNLGYKVKEVSVSWFNSAESRVRPLRDAWRTFKDLIYIKLNLWSGRYSEE